MQNLGGEKLGWPILSPPWLVKVLTLPFHEYANNLCFLGVGKNWAGPFFPHLDKIKQQPWAGGYLGGEKLAGPFFSHPDKWKHQPYTLSWIHIQPLLIRGWRKTGPAHSFTTLTIWVVTSESINLTPCHEYANNLCFLGGGEKLSRPILSPTWQDKASILCRWLTRWRKTGPAHSFPIPTSESINLTLSWICKQPLLFRRWGKTWPALSFAAMTTVFPHLVTFCTRLMFKLVRVGKEWAGSDFPPPPNKQRLHVYSWQGKVGCVFPQTINHMHNSFPPTDNLLNKVDV